MTSFRSPGILLNAVGEFNLKSKRWRTEALSTIIGDIQEQIAK